MDDHEASAVTRMLDAVARGEARASEDLLPLVYTDLRRLARARMARLTPGQTLQPTALVHDAFLRISRGTKLSWDHRGHFFAAAARAMREILIEQARAKASLKRGGDRNRVDPENLAVAVEAPAEDMLALDESLSRLETEHPRQHQVVMMRFFAGLGLAEAAEVLGLSTRTVERDWDLARAWLYADLTDPDMTT